MIEVQRIPPFVQTAKYRYVVQMLDGRELDLQSDGSLAAAMSDASEDLNDVSSWYVIGPGIGLRENLAMTEKDG